VQIVDHLLRVLNRRRLAATRKQLARTLHQLLLPAADQIGQLQAERDFLAGQPAISRLLRGGP
jgi:hypothetical protein